MRENTTNKFACQNMIIAEDMRDNITIIHQHNVCLLQIMRLGLFGSAQNNQKAKVDQSHMVIFLRPGP